MSIVPVIPSLLWTDLYIFTMAQAILHQCPSAHAKFEFVCRSKHAAPEGKEMQFLDRFHRETHNLCQLQLSSAELDYLSKISFFKPDFIEYLRLLRLNHSYVKVDGMDGGFKLTIEGPWLGTVWFEVPLLAICSHLYNTLSYDKDVLESNTGLVRLKEKVETLSRHPIILADFGTRRAYTTSWHHTVIEYMSRKIKMGTSNVYLAKLYGLKPIGTMAHQWIQAWQQLGPRLCDSQKVALQKWADEYRGDLGIALTDTIGIDAFLRDFDPYFAKLFDGVRHDSGDPYEWGSKVIAHYKKMGIDPKTKTLVFSDGLNVEKALELEGTFSPSAKIAFGIGGNLVQDMGVPPYQAVIKLIEINGKPVAKISDAPGKAICNDPEYLSYLKKVFNV